MIGKVILSKYTISLAAGSIGISVYYHGYYQPSHVIQSESTSNLLKEIYATKQNNREITGNKIGVIVFDGVCNICNSGIRFVDKYEKKNTNALFVAWAQNKNVSKPLLRNLNISDESIHDRFAFIEYDLRSETLRLYRASSAALQSSLYLKFPFNACIMGIIIPQTFRDWMYDIIGLVWKNAFMSNK